MLAITRPDSRLRAEAGDQPFAPLVSLPTRHGTYFVPGDLASLQALLQLERLEARDFLCDHPAFPIFLRKLFMLAAQEALSPTRDCTVRDLARALRPV